MKIGYKISLFAIITLLVITSSLATSYSLWTVSAHQTESNQIVAGCFNISFSEESPSISLPNTYPISDEVGESRDSYKFTLENTCTVAADYKLLISDLKSNTLDTSNIRYYLTKANTIYSPDALTNLTTYSLNDDQIKNSYVLATGILNPGDKETYELRLWVKEEATGIDLMDKEFEAIVSYEAYATNPTNH